MTKARELLLEGDIDSKDYKEIKAESERKIVMLESRIAEHKSGFMKMTEVEQILDSAIETLCKIDEIYSQSEPSKQREIIGSIFAQKFTFENLQHRTAQVSDVFGVIWLINSKLDDKKNGTNEDFSCLSHRVIPLGLYLNSASPCVSIFYQD